MVEGAGGDPVIRCGTETRKWGVDCALLGVKLRDMGRLPFFMKVLVESLGAVHESVSRENWWSSVACGVWRTVALFGGCGGSWRRVGLGLQPSLVALSRMHAHASLLSKEKQVSLSCTSLASPTAVASTLARSSHHTFLYLQEYFNKIMKKLKEVGASSDRTNFYV